MKNYIKSIIITVVLCTTVYSQLDSIVFVKWGFHIILHFVFVMIRMEMVIMILLLRSFQILVTISIYSPGDHLLIPSILAGKN